MRCGAVRSGGVFDNPAVRCGAVRFLFFTVRCGVDFFPLESYGAVRCGFIRGNILRGGAVRLRAVRLNLTAPNRTVRKDGTVKSLGNYLHPGQNVDNREAPAICSNIIWCNGRVYCRWYWASIGTFLDLVPSVMYIDR